MICRHPGATSHVPLFSPGDAKDRLPTDEEARVRNSRRHVKTLQHTVHIYMKNPRQSQQYLCCAILECLREEISADWLCCLLMINRPEGRPDCLESSQWNLFSDQKLLSEKSTIFRWSGVWTENQESIWIQSAFDIHNVTCNLWSDWLKKHLIQQVNYFLCFHLFPVCRQKYRPVYTRQHTHKHMCQGLKWLTAERLIAWVIQASRPRCGSRGQVCGYTHTCVFVCVHLSLTDTSGPVCAGDVTSRTGADVAAGRVGTFSTVAHSGDSRAFVDIWNERGFLMI